MAIRFNVSQVSGNLNGQTAGTAINGTALLVSENARQKLSGLAAHVTYTLATTSLTLTGKWQVSNDGTNWTTLANGPQNAASVAYATGPAVANSVAFSVSDSAYGYRYCRFVVTTGGATGAAGDLYSIGYSFRTPGYWRA